jgi:hypothetical protein
MSRLVVFCRVTAEGTFSGGDLGGGKMKATNKVFRGWSIGVLEVNDAGVLAGFQSIKSNDTRINICWIN